MKLWEVIKALEEGKKVKKKDWHDDYYIYKAEDGFIRDESNREYMIQNIKGTWELCDERLAIAKEWKELYKAIKAVDRVFECDNNCGNCILDIKGVNCIHLNIEEFLKELENLNKIYKLNK